MSKLRKLQSSGNTCYWIGAFLSNRDQICRYSGTVSKVGYFQPTICLRLWSKTYFVILTLDLNNVSKCNVIVNLQMIQLLVSENSDIGVEIEFNNVQEWACDNTTIVNLIKTKELIFL